MQPDSKPRTGPATPAFQQLKRLARALTKARAQCRCRQCMGSPYGDMHAGDEPCDGALEELAKRIGRRRSP